MTALPARRRGEALPSVYEMGNCPPTSNTDQQRRDAVLQVCANATDADDVRQLLAAIGLGISRGEADAS